MRLRPTARESTLRLTARPKRGEFSVSRQCKASTGSALRLPCWNMRSKSDPLRTRAVGGYFIAITSTKATSLESPSERILSGEDLAALGTTTCKDLATVCSCHTCAETVVALTLQIRWLECTLSSHVRALREKLAIKVKGKDRRLYRHFSDRASKSVLLFRLCEPKVRQ